MASVLPTVLYLHLSSRLDHSPGLAEKIAAVLGAQLGESLVDVGERPGPQPEQGRSCGTPIRGRAASMPQAEKSPACRGTTMRFTPSWTPQRCRGPAPATAAAACDQREVAGIMAALEHPLRTLAR